METNPLRSDIETIDTEFRKLARQSSGGCFLYFTSHGAPQGILIGDNLVAPQRHRADGERGLRRPHDGGRGLGLLLGHLHSGAAGPRTG